MKKLVLGTVLMLFLVADPASSAETPIFLDDARRDISAAVHYKTSNPAAIPVELNIEALSEPTFALVLEGETYLVTEPAREKRFLGEVLRFKLEKAIETSTLTRDGNLVVATIHVPYATYRLLPMKEGPGYELIKVDPGRISDCRVLTDWEAAIRYNKVPELLAAKRSESILGTSSKGRRRAIVFPPIPHNLAIYYMEGTIQAAGGEEKMKAEIRQAVDVSNTALRDTQVYDVENVIVLMKLKNGPEYQNISPTTDPLGVLIEDKEVLAERIQYKASAGMWSATKDIPSAVALTEHYAWALSGFYLITWTSGEVLDRAFTHEIGHTKGLDHDKASSAGELCPYCYAWANKAAESMDIMAYSTACDGAFCYIYNFYSNPRRFFRGYNGLVVPTGTYETQDAWRRLEDTKQLVSDFWRYVYEPPPPI